MAQVFVGPDLLKAGPTGNIYLAAVQDANNHLAVAQTKFTQTPNGLLVPEPADANGTPLHTSRITTQLTNGALGASGDYTQAWQDAQSLAVTYVAGSVTADQAGTLYVDYSDDGTNVARTTTLLAFAPNTAGTANADTPDYPVSIPTRYFRFRYVNGATAQGSFALYQTPLSDWSPRDVGLTGSLPPRKTSLVTLVSALTTVTKSGTFVSPAFNPQGYNRGWVFIGNVSGTALNYAVYYWFKIDPSTNSFNSVQGNYPSDAVPYINNQSGPYTGFRTAAMGTSAWIEIQNGNTADDLTFSSLSVLLWNE